MFHSLAEAGNYEEKVESQNQRHNAAHDCLAALSTHQFALPKWSGKDTMLSIIHDKSFSSIQQICIMRQSTIESLYE